MGLSRVIVILCLPISTENFTSDNSGIDYAKLFVSWPKQTEGMIGQCYLILILTCIDLKSS